MSTTPGANEESKAETTYYSMKEVSKHDTEDDMWIVIGNAKNGGPKVYNVTEYVDDHPGGADSLIDNAGKYADDMFEDIGHSGDARKILKTFHIGDLTEEDANQLLAETSKTAAEISSRGGLSFGAVAVVALAVGAGFYFTKM